MSKHGVPASVIAAFKGIDPKTLRKHFRDELDVGMASSRATLCQVAFWMATGMREGSLKPDISKVDKTILIFLLRTQLGFKPVDRLEVTGANGGPVQHQTSVDLSSWPTERLEKLIGVLEENSVDEDQPLSFSGLTHGNA